MRISISIPTFNRCKILDEWLKLHSEFLYKNHIDIYVSDNCSNDNTAEVVGKWQSQYANIIYCPLSYQIKAEANFERAINLPKSGWVWLVGDSYCIDEMQFSILKDQLFKVSNTQTSLCVINLEDRVKNIPQGLLQKEEALSSLSGLVSCISCVIYDLDILESVEFTDKNDTYFPHVSYFFTQLENTDQVAAWLPAISVNMIETNERRKNWASTHAVWDISIDSWVAVIANLEGYNSDSKSKAMTQFGVVSGLFSLKGLLWLRAQGLLTTESIRKHRNGVKLAIRVPYIFLRLFALIPIFPLKMAARMLGYK